MTPNEYKAWLDGFSEGIKGSPTKEQWEKIKNKTMELHDSGYQYPVYFPLYQPAPTYQPIYPSWGTYTVGAGGGVCETYGGGSPIGGATSFTVNAGVPQQTSGLLN